MSFKKDLNRRKFLKLIAGGTAYSLISPISLLADNSAAEPSNPDENIKDYISKIKNFDKPHPTDVILTPQMFNVLKSSYAKLRRVQRTVGYGNFNLISFDEVIKIARNYRRVGPFTKEELHFMEMVFYEKSSKYGFGGEKVLKNITDKVKRKETIKVPYSGHFLYRGDSLILYNKLRKDVGTNLILTSGIRSIIKQFILFLGKAKKHKGNLSLASRSLAPPGYSFHGIGDFDVGLKGYGGLNFTSKFTKTTVYKKIKTLDYISLRYTNNNLIGVRFEPWHIKVNKKA
ncbi:MAG: peptidase M15 [Desulfobacterales bacterium]|nr:peptidase M15 [Desulfobacterales bacterium]MCP4159569.1 peptidase M15 [Deltaproteobacteria bacterium]